MRIVYKRKIMPEKLAFEPPEPQYITEKEIFDIPISDQHLKKPWGLRLYASELVQQRLGDEAQVTSIKVKKPGILEKTKAKWSSREPYARLQVTIKF